MSRILVVPLILPIASSTQECLRKWSEEFNGYQLHYSNLDIGINNLLAWHTELFPARRVRDRPGSQLKSILGSGLIKTTWLISYSS